MGDVKKIKIKLKKKKRFKLVGTDPESPTRDARFWIIVNFSNLKNT